MPESATGAIHRHHGHQGRAVTVAQGNAGHGPGTSVGGEGGLVFGGGAIGMLTALELAQAGEAVTLFERGETGRESSWAGGGIVSPLYPWRYSSAISSLSRWSEGEYPRLAEALKDATGIDPEYRQKGLIYLRVEDEALALAAAIELGLHESQLYGWRAKSRAERDQSETERNQATAIARLKRKGAEQAEELAIVKKAAAYFAKGLK
mgnify:CR=1 FL=1